MLRTRTSVRIGLLAAAFLIVVVPPARGSIAEGRRHTRLVKSEPAANDTLASPPRAIRLWFSEAVELPVTTVRLTDAAGTTVALARLARPDTGPAAPVVAATQRPLTAGSYVVAWSTAAKDGHPAKGSYSFVVKAAP